MTLVGLFQLGTFCDAQSRGAGPSRAGTEVPGADSRDAASPRRAGPFPWFRADTQRLRPRPAGVGGSGAGPGAATGPDSPRWAAERRRRLVRGRPAGAGGCHRGGWRCRARGAERCLSPERRVWSAVRPAAHEGTARSPCGAA